MTEWSFLTNHARVLVCIAHDPGVRLRDIATTLDITERSAYSIVTDLTASGYVVKAKDGRRNRYQIQAHLPLREAITQQRTIGEVLDVLVESDTRQATTSARVIRRPVTSLARVLPHSLTATHPTFVREAARSDAVVSSPVVTGQLPDRPKIDHRTRGCTVGNPMVARAAAATAGPQESADTQGCTGSGDEHRDHRVVEPPQAAPGGRAARQAVVRRRGSEQGGQTDDVDGRQCERWPRRGRGLVIEDLSTCPRVPCQSAFDR